MKDKEIVEKMENKEETKNKEIIENGEKKEKEKKIINKILWGLNKFFNSIAFPIFIGILLLLKTILFYENTITIREIIDKDLIIGTSMFLITFICIICVLPNRTRTVSTIILDILLSILLLGDNLYYKYSSSVLSVAQMTNLQYGEEIMGTIPMLLEFKQILYLIDIVLIVVLLLSKVLKIEKKKKASWKVNVLRILSGVVAIYLFCTVDAEYVEKAGEDPYNKDAQVKKGTIYGYHVADLESLVNIKKNAKYDNKKEMLSDYEKLKEDYNEKYGESNYNLEGIAKGKNVIIVQLESVQEFVINKTINGKEITPNINKFINENINFSNMFMQSYSTTADSEFSTVTSLYPMENGMSYSRYYSNKYDDIFTMFKNVGYDTSYMHGNYGYFWNRENVYKSFGVDHLELKDQFEDTSEDVMGYLSDELLYKQAVEKIKTYNMPFFSYIVSASSHTAFTLDGLQDRSKVNIDVGKYKGTFFGNYLEAVNYADYAFGTFIEELKDADLYDNSVILIYGDHNGIDMYNAEMLDFLEQINPDLNDVDIKLNYIRVACGMKIPGIENLTIEKPVNKLDIKPTFEYLIKENAGVSLGTNMFARKDFVCLNNERIVTSRYYYDEKWYRRIDGTEVNLENGEIPEDEKELLEEYYNDMKEELDISTSISINNLLK